MLVIRLADGGKAHRGTRKPGGGIRHSIKQSILNVSFGNNENGQKM